MLLSRRPAVFTHSLVLRLRESHRLYTLPLLICEVAFVYRYAVSLTVANVNERTSHALGNVRVAATVSVCSLVSQCLVSDVHCRCFFSLTSACAPPFLRIYLVCLWSALLLFFTVSLLPPFVYFLLESLSVSYLVHCSRRRRIAVYWSPVRH